MISLFLNTSSEFLSAAITKDNIIHKEIYIKLGKKLSKMALSNIKNLIDEVNIKPKDINEIICVNGPGSFTGLRVGVTIAKTFCYSINAELIPLSSLFVMATSIKDVDYIIPLIDARREYVYAGIYDKNYNIVLEDSYIKLDELKNKVNELKGTYKYVSNDDLDLDVVKFLPDLNNTFKYMKRIQENYISFTPNYLKKTEAEEKL